MTYQPHQSEDASLKPVAGEWHDDKADQWSEAIDAAHPLRSKNYAAYDEALQMVGNRKSKGALVELVCWLLQRDARAATIDTADHVHHAPSGEDWVVAFVRGDKLCACGWPETMADLKDCTLLRKASQAERNLLIREMAKSDGARGSFARACLEPADPARVEAMREVELLTDAEVGDCECRTEAQTGRAIQLALLDKINKAHGLRLSAGGKEAI